MERLSGVRQEDIIGKNCPEEYVIMDSAENQEQFIKVSRPECEKVEIKKVVQA